MNELIIKIIILLLLLIIIIIVIIILIIIIKIIIIIIMFIISYESSIPKTLRTAVLALAIVGGLAGAAVGQAGGHLDALAPPAPLIFF